MVTSLGTFTLFHYQLANRKHAASYTFFARQAEFAVFLSVVSVALQRRESSSFLNSIAATATTATATATAATAATGVFLF